MKPAGDGGMIILEARLYESTNLSNVVVSKLNASGDSIWSIILKGTQQNPEAAAIAIDPNTGGIFVGFQAMNGFSSDTRVGFINKDGQLFGDSTHLFDLNENEELSSITNTADGGFVMTINSAPDRGFYKGSIVKVKFDFTIEWSSEDSTNTYTKVLGLASGDFICIGGEKMVKYNAKGIRIWTKTWENANLFGVCELSDSSIVAVGQGGVLQVVKVSGNGKEMWNKNYAGTGNPVIYPAFYDVKLASDGKLLFAGSNNTGTTIEYFFVKADGVGNIQWTRSFYTSTANPANRFTSIQTNPDGGFAFLSKYDNNWDGYDDRTAFYRTDSQGFINKLYIETDIFKAGKAIVFDDGKGGRGSVTFNILGEIKKMRIDIFGDSMNSADKSIYRFIKRFISVDVAAAQGYYATLKFPFYESELNGMQPGILQFFHHDTFKKHWESFEPKSISTGIGTSYFATLNLITKFSEWTLGAAPIDNVLNNKLDKNIITCFPNPGSGDLSLKFNEQISGTVDIEIFDIKGSRVHREVLEACIGTVQKLGIENLSPGCYIIKVTNNAISTTLKYMAR